AMRHFHFGKLILPIFQPPFVTCLEPFGEAEVFVCDPHSCCCDGVVFGAVRTTFFSKNVYFNALLLMLVLFSRAELGRVSC
ncbi:MAG: hypothetical protein K0U50_09010, partial [Alphaproteobacteria bacterium]|nr:hypothetical protein [Alphaproteobacteria bacterium]